MRKVNTADIGFEDKIWKAADKMRGNIDALKYKLMRTWSIVGFYAKLPCRYCRAD